MPHSKREEMLNISALLALRVLGARAGALLKGASALEVCAPDLSMPGRLEVFPALAAKLRSSETLEETARQIADWLKNGVGVISVFSQAYPALLARIYNPPVILFYKGEIDCLAADLPALAIVGSRRGDLAGCDIARQMAQRLASYGNCVVSGLALGIDAAAHCGALDAGGGLPTVAVLGSGLFNVYPAANRPLAEKILAGGGLLLSQFEPNEKPYPVNFLNRNRVIAGLSLGVLVVQATRKSGALATARFALEEGREVLAVPGAIADPRHAGTNNLIRQGAHLISSCDDIFESVSGLCRSFEIPLRSASRPLLEQRPFWGQDGILRFLRENGAVSYDELARLVGEKDPAFASHVVELELSGCIRRLPGNFLELCAKI